MSLGGAQPVPVLGEPTVVAEDVHITYRVFEDRRPHLRDVFARRFRPRPSRAILAVRGVSLVARGGEMIGVLGPNGSGKSTLMMGLAGLLPLDHGEVYARSRPSLLGVSAVLRSALSGRRNVMIGCLALGMSRQEADERFDDIVAFAGLEDFIDLPMRAYSSGMRARLHFAIATSVTPEILLIDEALAVGDQEFRERSMGRVRELQQAAGTVFLVTHNLNELREHCTRAIWMEKGEVVEEGEPNRVVDAYLARHGARAKP